MSIKTPNYVTTEEYKYYKELLDQRVLPAGTFVRPIHPSYLPSHVLNDDVNRWFNAETEVFVYCSYGIIAIPKNIIRKV